MKCPEAVNLIRHIEDAQEAAECLAKEAITRGSRSQILLLSHSLWLKHHDCYLTVSCNATIFKEDRRFCNGYLFV